MANQVYFKMKVKGTKENVVEFVEVLKGNRTQHFVCTSVDEVEDMVTLGEKVTQIVTGYCDQSIGYGLNDMGNLMSKYPSITNLTTESTTLNIDIEVYSKEPAMCFEEHFCVSNGNILVDEVVECVDYHWIKEDFPTIEAFNEAYETSFKEDDFSVDGFLTVGGYPEWNFSF